MKTIASYLRSLQFFAHNAHNLVYGEYFHQDHEYFAELYQAYESAYDSIVERMIGLGQKIDLGEITLSAAESVKGLGKEMECKKIYSILLDSEKKLVKQLESAMSGKSQGTQNMLQDMADQSEQRQYKIQQRLKS